MDRAEEIIYGNIVENISDGILLADFDGTIRRINQAAAHILGSSAEKLQGRKLANLLEEDAANDAFFQCIMDAVYTKKTKSDIVPYLHNGERRQLRMVSSLLVNGTDKIGLVILLSDLTQVVELGQKNEALSRKLAGFLNRFVQVMIGAVEARTPYNANHTKKMVQYATAYLNWLETKGREDIAAIRAPLLASVWLHDIGKLVVPRSVMDKATRLGSREKDVFHRIEVAVLCERLRIAESLIARGTDGDRAGAESTECVRTEAEETIRVLQEAKALIQKVNRMGYLDDVTAEKMEVLGRMQCLTPDGSYVQLLDEYEKEALQVRRGTLTAGERRVIESHVVHTREMLDQMGFEGDYQNVCVWAGGHHEYLDGSGYPQQLTAEQIPWETRLLTIIDIYDSLTADDRPYKSALPPEKAFHILEQMCDEGKLDGEILHDFYESRAWEKN